MATLNMEGLSNEFEVEFTDYEPEQDDSVLTDDTETIIRKNIMRANTLLDKVEHEIYNGSFSARLIEVAGQLINSVSQATANLNLSQYNAEYLQLRNRLLELERVKVSIKQNSGGVTNQNIIVTDRETVLKMLEEGKTPLLEDKKEHEEVYEK